MASKKQTQTIISKSTGLPVDRVRSRAAKKAAATRKANATVKAESTRALRLHHKIIAGGMVTAVLVFTFLAIRSQLQTFAASTSTGSIVGLAGKCLDNRHSITANRNQVQLYQCNGTNAQKWTLASDSSLHSSNGSGNYCLDVPGASKAQYTYVQLYQCNGTNAQKWSIANNTLVSKLTGFCVTVKNAATSNSTRLWMKSCHGSNAQKWVYGGSSPVAVTTPNAPSITTPPPSSTPSPTPSQSAGTRDPRYFPFSATSPWNTSIGSGAQFDSSTAATTKSFQARGTAINQSSWSVAVYVASTSDPLAQIVDSSSGALKATAYIPKGAQPTGGSDGWFVSIQPDKRHAQEAYGVSHVSDTKYTSKHGYTFLTDLEGDGLNGGTRASHTSLLAGLIREADLQQGAINHALGVTIDGSQLKSGYIWPASQQDSDAASSYSGTIPMGSLFAIPASVDVTKLGLDSEGVMLARALQSYGAYVVARSGTVALMAEPSADTSTISKLRSDWSTLRSQMRRVTNSSANNVAGGGTRSRPALPAFQ